jgi:hypothetical protein
MSLIRLVYASESHIRETERESSIAGIVASARRLNLQNDITGYLLVTSGGFAQVLEGEQDAVAETYGRILADPRHTAIKLLLEDAIAQRSFQRWSMGLAEYDETTHFIFGLYGVTPEADLFQHPVETLIDLASELSLRP